MVVSSLVDADAAGLAQHVEGDVLELGAQVLGDELAAGEDGDVLQHGLAAVAEAGRLDGRDVEGALDPVDDQGGQGLAFDVLGDDDERPAGLDAPSPGGGEGRARWRSSSRGSRM